MQHTSDLWKDLWQNPNTELEYRVEFEGWGVSQQNIIPPIKLTRNIMPDDGGFGVGTVYSHVMTVSIRGEAARNIPVGGKVLLSVRLRLGRTDSPDTIFSEWLPKGTYFIEKRKVTLERADFECVDRVCWLNDIWVSGVSEHYNPAMRDAARIICDGIDLEIANIEAIPAGYIIRNANDLTKRQVISFIASASGCNAAIDDYGKLRFYPLKEPDFYIDVGRAIQQASEINDPITVKKLTVNYSDGDDAYHTVGIGNAAEEMVLYNEWITEAMAGELLSRLYGYTYNPVSVNSAHIDPAAELMDGVIADGMKTQMLNTVTNISGHFLVSLLVPNEGVLGSEIGRYIGQYDLDSDRRYNRLRTYLLSVIVACEHVSSDTINCVLRPKDENVRDLKSEGTYHFTVGYPIPGAPNVVIVDRDGKVMANRPWKYTNGGHIRSSDIIMGARIEIRDSGEYFFSNPPGIGGASGFQVTIADKILKRYALPGYGVAVRGSI